MLGHYIWNIIIKNVNEYIIFNSAFFLKIYILSFMFINKIKRFFIKLCFACSSPAARLSEVVGSIIDSASSRCARRKDDRRRVARRIADQDASTRAMSSNRNSHPEQSGIAPANGRPRSDRAGPRRQLAPASPRAHHARGDSHP